MAGNLQVTWSWGGEKKCRVRGGTKDVTVIMFSKDKGERIKDELWKRRERES